MRDVMKRCAVCTHDHPCGILRHSRDNVPLYGARKCPECGCGEMDFSEYQEGSGNLPAMTKDQMGELWAKTDFLSPQVPTATRMMVAQIMAVDEDGKSLLSADQREREFMGLVISQLTDVRGALVRDESKFAHLIAHTDEIVESMRNAAQLGEQLRDIREYIGRALAAEKPSLWSRIRSVLFRSGNPRLRDEEVEV